MVEKKKGIPVDVLDRFLEWVFSLIEGFIGFIKEWGVMLVIIILLIVACLWILSYLGFFSGHRPMYEHLYKTEQVVRSGEDQLLRMADTLAEEMLIKNDAIGATLIREEYTIDIILGAENVRKFSYMFLVIPNSGWWRFGVICSQDGDYITCITHPLERSY